LPRSSPVFGSGILVILAVSYRSSIAADGAVAGTRGQKI